MARKDDSGRPLTHGATVYGKASPEYMAWQNIKQRCFRESTPNYANYGGRGITLFGGWINDFAAFLAHVGLRPSRHHSIERIHNDKGYVPGNICWATRRDQLRNRRNNVILTVNGESRCVADWAELTGMSYSRIRKRMRLGWAPERCIDPTHYETVPMLITANGETLPAQEWAKRLGTTSSTVRKRIDNGWTPANAATKPLKPYRQKKWRVK